MTANKKKPKKHQVYYFKYFTLSSIIFLASLGTVIYVDILLPESDNQELLALTGLAFSIPSGLLAFYCYIQLLLTRFKNFMDN